MRTGAVDHGVGMGCAARKSQKPALEIGGGPAVHRFLGSTASLSSDKSISTADLGKMTNFAHYDHYEIRITMRREHSAALKYMAAEQRLGLALA